MLGSDAVPSLLNNQVIGVFTANTADGSKAFYNTLATINVVQTLSYGKVLTANRNVTALFYVSQRSTIIIFADMIPKANETFQYGWGIYARPSATDNFLYLFDKAAATKGSAIRIARVPQATMTDRSTVSIANRLDFCFSQAVIVYLLVWFSLDLHNAHT